MNNPLPRGNPHDRICPRYSTITTGRRPTRASASRKPGATPRAEKQHRHNSQHKAAKNSHRRTISEPLSRRSQSAGNHPLQFSQNQINPLNTENRKISSLLPQLRMRPIAKRRIRRLLAHAPSHLLLLRDLQLHRREAFALVRPVAKRLRRRISAGTPPISSRLHFFDHRRLPTTVRRIHHFHITRPRPRLNHQSPLNRPL